MFKTILLFSICLIHGLIVAQVDLSKLHKAQPTDLDFSQPLMLDGKSIPVCLSTGRQIPADSLDFYLGTTSFLSHLSMTEKRSKRSFFERHLSRKKG
jgi:hypothetical protein